MESQLASSAQYLIDSTQTHPLYVFYSVFPHTPEVKLVDSRIQFLMFLLFACCSRYNGPMLAIGLFFGEARRGAEE